VSPVESACETVRKQAAASDYLGRSRPNGRERHDSLEGCRPLEFLGCNQDGQWVWLDDVAEGAVARDFAREFARKVRALDRVHRSVTSPGAVTSRPGLTVR
jgi:hypothetical protein